MHFQMDIADIAGNPACARARAPVTQQTMWKQSLVVYILRKSCLDIADHPLHTVWNSNKTNSSPAFCIHLTRVKLFCVLTLFLQNYIHIHSYKTQSTPQQTYEGWMAWVSTYLLDLAGPVVNHYTGDGGIAISLLVHWSPSRHMQTCKRYMTMFKMYVHLSAKHTCTSKYC